MKHPWLIFTPPPPFLKPGGVTAMSAEVQRGNPQVHTPSDQGEQCNHKSLLPNLKEASLCSLDRPRPEGGYDPDSLRVITGGAQTKPSRNAFVRGDVYLDHPQHALRQGRWLVLGWGQAGVGGGHVLRPWGRITWG